MKKLRSLLVVFDNDLQPWQIPAFRGAIVDKVGRDNMLFHNHIDDEKFLHRYPLIQYKSVQKKPAIFCLETGVDEIHKLFERRTWDITLGTEPVQLIVDKLDLKSINLNVWDKKFNYRIARWQALNSENYKKYNQLDGLADRMLFLENILKANILSFAKGVDWHIEKPVVVKIKNVVRESIVKQKEIKVQVFDIEFATNVFLPNYIGLGKGAALGFGVVHENRTRVQQTKTAEVGEG